MSKHGEILAFQRPPTISATEDLLVASGMACARELARRQNCAVNIYTGRKDGKWSVWVREDSKGPPDNADCITRQFTVYPTDQAAA